MTKKMFVLGAAFVAGGLAAIAVGDLIAFQPGTAIKSADVNNNFSMLRTAVAALEAPVGSSRLADGAVTLPKLTVGGTAADGKVLKLQGGALTWGDDLTGGGGAAYSAGAGLALSGSTFSVANGGITGAMLADGAVSGGKLAVPLIISAGAVSAFQVNTTLNSTNEGSITGTNTGSGNGVRGISNVGTGIYGETNGSGRSTIGVFGQAIGTATGVLGASTNGTGVWASSATGNALEVEGPIRVSGRADRRAAFVQVKTTANSNGPSQTCTGITDPNAILIVTHNYTASGDQTLNAPIGVVRSPGGLWCIYRQDGQALANGFAFNVMVMYAAP